jgi:AdoMet-dependent heme synthase
LSSEEYEATLEWILQKQQELGDRLMFKPTDAPHYHRIAKQCGASLESGHTPSKHSGASQHGLNSLTRGCLAGTGFCFISHTGKVQGCGYLDIEAGDLRKNTFSEVWYDSPLFQDLRDLEKLKGKCGRCDYKVVCGGCRARAYEATGDYLAAEPYCIYKPDNLAFST